MLQRHENKSGRLPADRAAIAGENVRHGRSKKNRAATQGDPDREISPQDAVAGCRGKCCNRMPSQGPDIGKKMECVSKLNRQ